MTADITPEVMTTGMIFMSMLFMGFSCSVGCGSVASTFVLGTQIGENGSIESCMKAILLFCFGKVVSLALMGFLSSIFGMIILTYIETLYPNSTVWIVRGVTCLFGISVIASAFRKKEEQAQATDIQGASGCSSCASCSSCSSKQAVATKTKSSEKMVKGSYFFAGLLYATIPCAPLVTTLTYASTMTPILGTLLLALFGVVNSIVPVCLHATIIGQANSELAKETPYLMKPLKVLGGGLLMYMGMFVV